jgi:hypothetical protein
LAVTKKTFTFKKYCTKTLTAIGSNYENFYLKKKYRIKTLTAIGSNYENFYLKKKNTA